MARAGKLHHCICLLGIAMFVWSYYALPGVYYGGINGRITIIPPDDAEVYCYYDVGFSSQTRPRWQWTKPNNFCYGHIDLTINDNTELTVLFPSLTCKYAAEEETLSKALLKDLITADSQAESDIVTPEQLNELYNFIVSAGDGTLPRPRHHTYYLESPYCANFTHFLLGGAPIPILGAIVLAIGIALRFLGTPRTKNVSGVGDQQQAPYTVSLVVIAVLVNCGVFFLAVYLSTFRGAIDMLGAILCTTASIVGSILIPVSILYSFVRRFATKIRLWDFFGPYLSVLFYFIMMLVLQPLRL